MSAIRLLSVLLLATASASASATSTLCRFNSPMDSSGYDLEFIGYNELAMIQVDLPKGPRSLPDGSYEVLEFDERTETIHLEYRNPGDPSLPQSFTLKGAGRNVRMSIGQEQIVGELDCDF